MPLDPITTMTTISVALKLLDQFRELALRFLEKPIRPPSGTAEQVENTIQIKYDGRVEQTISAEDMNLTEWDQVRVQTLERRIRLNWNMFNELDAQIVLLAVDERVRIKLQMDRIKNELCEDFRNLVRLFEATLNYSLPDHYSLYEVCGS